MIGQPGKKYGLIKGKKPVAMRPRPSTGPPSVFSSNPDDDDNADLASTEAFNAMLQVRNQASSTQAYEGRQVVTLICPPQSQSQAAKKKLEAAQAAALAEDPSLYDYDGVYDKLQAERSERERLATASEPEKKKSKYIENLKKVGRHGLVLYHV
jgi:coiled-coil domain-containing protein 55